MCPAAWQPVQEPASACPRLFRNWRHPRSQRCLDDPAPNNRTGPLQPRCGPHRFQAIQQPDGPQCRHTTARLRYLSARYRAPRRWDRLPRRPCQSAPPPPSRLELRSHRSKARDRNPTANGRPPRIGPHACRADRCERNRAPKSRVRVRRWSQPVPRQLGRPQQ